MSPSRADLIGVGALTIGVLLVGYFNERLPEAVGLALFAVTFTALRLLASRW